MDLIFSSASDLGQAIRERRVSAIEALDAHLAQIEKHNAALNAVVTLDADQARSRAHQADDALARGDVWGPLHGVPFTLKDCHATAGVRTTTGFPPLANHVPAADGTIAARLKAAGGILMGKTNVAMMLADPAQSSNPVFGRTSNPWNVERTPGGSSGGPAAAIASGMTPFDIGTDLAGSIRIPAHFSGVFGLKPTENRVSLDGVIPGLPSPRSVRIMSCVGPMARSMEDLRLLYSLIAGPDGRDTDVRPMPIDLADEASLQDLRIAVAPTFADIPVASDIRGAIEEVSSVLTPLCAAVDQPALPKLDFKHDLSSVGELIGMLVGAFQPNARPAPLSHYFEALHRRDQSILAWERFFDDWDVLLCPASMTTAFTHRDTGAPLEVDGREVEYWAVNAHTTPFNYSGHPAVVLPYKKDRDGLPIGFQLVGKRWEESRLLAIASAISGVTGGFKRPPALV
jgi:amidase